MKLHLVFWAIFLPILFTNCKTAKFTASNSINSCGKADKVTGANFIFLIDNSGSMTLTDCLNPNAKGICSEATEREKAILASFDRLVEITEQSENPKEAMSVFTIAKFSPDVRRGKITDINKPIYAQFETKASQRAKLAETLKFTREPKGDTPFEIAVQYTKRFLDEQNNQKRNVAVLVTDGEPTDTNPDVTLKNASQLPLDRFTIRINTKGDSINERYTSHKSIIEKYYTNDQNGWTTNYEDIESYMNDLMSLATNFSQSMPIDIKSAKGLETAIFDEVIRTTINSCNN